jgi:hypothetical protein
MPALKHTWRRQEQLMNTRWPLQRLGLPASALLIGAFACRVETVELHGLPATGGSSTDLDDNGLISAGAVGELPGQADPTPSPTDAPGAAQMPDVDFSLPDAGMDLSPLPPAPGCGAVDFLFVIDNSLSMSDEQDNLVQSFGGFMQVVQSTLDARDYHIMAVDTDDRGIGIGGIIGGPFASPSSCNGVFGAGRNQSASGLDCGITDDATFMTQAQSDLPAAFECAARVGTFGDVLEQPMTAMLSAVTPALNGAGGCNEGFLRDDAILVVTFITDEDDTRSPGDPTEWHTRLVEAKGGDESAVVVLGLVGDSNLSAPLEGGPCILPDASPAPRLQEFVLGLKHGSLGSVCAEDYSLFLAQAAAEIKQSCDSFTPPLR